MLTTIKTYFPAFLIGFSVLLFSIFSTFIIFGQDGLNLWYPILSEFARGHYETSQVVFGGQNLLGIYGKLPFWNLLKTPDLMINLSFGAFFSFLFYFSSVIYKNMAGSLSRSEQVIIGLYCLFSSVITNRIYSGHFNLLFGMLPLLVAISSIYCRSILHLIISCMALWLSFSIQGYQILVYHIFYLPLLIVWMKAYPSLDIKKYLLSLSVIVLGAFALAWPSFSQMLAHSKDPNNMRGAIDGIVYSYLTSELRDLPSLFFSSVNSLSVRHSFSYFHELNYPLGASILFLIFSTGSNRKILTTIILTLFFLFLFSANVPPFNLLSELPLIKLFRVPQRGMMALSFLLPLVCLVSLKEFMTGRSLILLLVLAVLGNGVPYFEVYATLIFGILILKPSFKYRDATVALLLSTVMLGLPEKIEEIRGSNQRFFEYSRYVKDLDQKLHLQGKTVHFESNYAIQLSLAANTHGIRTIVGYGHPPKRLVDMVQQTTRVIISPMSNTILLSETMPNFKELALELGITDVIFVKDDGSFFHKKLE